MYSSTQILHEIERGELADSYLLVGEEEHLKEEAVRMILARTLSPEAENFDRTVLHGDTATTEEVMSALASSPMLAAKRAVVIRNAHLLNGDTKSQLIDYVVNPVKSTCLILLAGKVDLRKGFFGNLLKTTKTLDFRRVTRGETSRLLLSYLKKHGVAITDEARELLLESVGSEILKLVGELDKLVSYKGGAGRIDKEDVERLVDSGRLDNIFKLQELVGKRRVKEALAVVEQLLLWNESPTRILASLGGFYLTLLKLKQEPDDAPLEVSARKFKLSSFYLRKCASHLPNFSESALIAALDLTNQTERKIKEGAGCVKPLLTTYIDQVVAV